jgi:hypothetical protein
MDRRTDAVGKENSYRFSGKWKREPLQNAVATIENSYNEKYNTVDSIDSYC